MSHPAQCAQLALLTPPIASSSAHATGSRFLAAAGDDKRKPCIASLAAVMWEGHGPASVAFHDFPFYLPQSLALPPTWTVELSLPLTIPDSIPATLFCATEARLILVPTPSYPPADAQILRH